MRLFSVLASIKAALLAGVFATAAAPAPARMAISVQPSDWGSAQVQDIEAVLGSVADVLAPYFPLHASDRVQVAFDKQGPRVLFERSPEGAYLVHLNVRDTRWDQFSYQFSHELCHIFANFERRRIGGDGNVRDHQWFEEALCEAVSMLVLDRMASTWKHSPPHPGWEHYAPAFREYAARVRNESRRRLRPNQSTQARYRDNQEELEGDPYLREKHGVLAGKLLPLLEDAPDGLQAIAYLNLEKPYPRGSFRAYLESWYNCCPDDQRGFVSQVISLLDGQDRARRSVGSSTNPVELSRNAASAAR